ncbi:MAG TPA: hypothetical protein VMZ52_06715 [Bryobacteraceae bacterium]|nr:hypothetical protein [Bryobacteraceae bacterium]
MLSFILLLATGTLAFAADDSWAKVKALKGGTEIRVYKVGLKQPLVAKLDEADDDRILIATKTEQVAIPKDQIDRVDARPSKTNRVTVENKTKTEVNTHTAESTTPHGPAGPKTSSSSGISIGGKADFEMLYRRLAAPR